MQKYENWNFVLIMVWVCSNELKRTTQVIFWNCIGLPYPIEPNIHTKTQFGLKYASEFETNDKGYKIVNIKIYIFRKKISQGIYFIKGQIFGWKLHFWEIIKSWILVPKFLNNDKKNIFRQKPQKICQNQLSTYI